MTAAAAAEVTPPMLGGWNSSALLLLPGSVPTVSGGPGPSVFVSDYDGVAPVKWLTWNSQAHCTAGLEGKG